MRKKRRNQIASNNKITFRFDDILCAVIEIKCTLYMLSVRASLYRV